MSKYTFDEQNIIWDFIKDDKLYTLLKITGKYVLDIYILFSNIRIYVNMHLFLFYHDVC